MTGYCSLEVRFRRDINICVVNLLFFPFFPTGRSSAFAQPCTYLHPRHVARCGLQPSWSAFLLTSFLRGENLWHVDDEARSQAKPWRNSCWKQTRPRERRPDCTFLPCGKPRKLSPTLIRLWSHLRQSGCRNIQNGGKTGIEGEASYNATNISGNEYC